MTGYSDGQGKKAAAKAGRRVRQPPFALRELRVADVPVLGLLIDGSVRPGCNDGAIPANGLLYVGPWLTSEGAENLHRFREQLLELQPQPQLGRGGSQVILHHLTGGSF